VQKQNDGKKFKRTKELPPTTMSEEKKV